MVLKLCIDQHLENWPKSLPVCVHAEGQTVAAVLLIAQLSQRPIHVCHVATGDEVIQLSTFYHWMAYAEVVLWSMSLSVGWLDNKSTLWLL